MKKKNLLITAVAIFGFATITFGQSVPSYIPTSGLVGWWPFNGNANDESGNGNNGTVNGATLTNDRFGNVNKAYSFDGVDDLINVGNPIQLSIAISSYSQSAWVFFFDTPVSFGSYPIISKRHDNTGNDWSTPVFRSSQNFWFFADDANYSGPTYAMSSTISLGTWKHTVFVKENDSYKIYLDGVLDVSIVDNHTMNGSSNDLIFGAQLAWPQYFKGLIDDISIWNRVLSECEISDLYNSQLGSLNTSDTQIQTALDSYTWPINNQTYTQSGTYSAVIQNAAGCDSTITLDLSLDFTGLEENSYGDLFSVFPNPACSIINVNAANKLIGDVYFISDNAGRIVLTGKLNSQNTTIELGNLSGGIYMFRVGDHMKKTLKVIKE
ncbi:MAG: hypothetical protein RL528_310 [Bacteroidota bacterium]|jgi:hypothetical protein